MNKLNEKLIKLENLLKSNSFESSLKEIAKTTRGCWFTNFLNQIYNLYKNEFNELFDRLNTQTNYNVDIKFLSQYLQGNTHNCIICGNLCLKQNETCSRECQAKNHNVISKRKQTNIQKFGVENPYQNDEIKKKLYQTQIEKYGCYYTQTEEYKERVKATNRKKFGFDYASQSPEIQLKRKKTELERYGVNVSSKCDAVKQKQIETNICKYGAKSYTLSEEYKNTCQKWRENMEWNQQKHIKNKELLNYDYVNTHFIENGLFLFNDFCKFFNLSSFGGNTHKTSLGFTQQNKNEKSLAQLELFNSINTNNKLLNDRDLINPLELDIVLPDIKLAIEYNGIYWHSDLYKEPKYHLDKTIKCQEKGYQLFHIFETDNIEIWKSMINNKLKLNKKVYARKCIIKELKYSEIEQFLNENHIQGSCSSKINLGLFYDDKLVQVMTFSKPRFNRNYDYELIRMCSLKGYSVIGGASKLFKYFINNYLDSKKKIITYANLRFSNGSIYEKLGFKYLKTSNPNYFYFKDGILESRNKYQKHKLSKLLDSYNPNKSESENMKANGYLRIYDCGNLVYEYTKYSKD